MRWTVKWLRRAGHSYIKEVRDFGDDVLSAERYAAELAAKKKLDVALWFGPEPWMPGGHQSKVYVPTNLGSGNNRSSRSAAGSGASA